MSSKNDLVIFGALGDLSNRKLFPALYQLDRAGLLDDSVRIAALARDDVSTPVFIEQLQVVLAQAFGETTFGETTLDKTRSATSGSPAHLPGQYHRWDKIEHQRKGRRWL